MIIRPRTRRPRGQLTFDPTPAAKVSEKARRYEQFDGTFE